MVLGSQRDVLKISRAADQRKPGKVFFCSPLGHKSDFEVVPGFCMKNDPDNSLNFLEQVQDLHRIGCQIDLEPAEQLIRFSQQTRSGISSIIIFSVN